MCSGHFAHQPTGAFYNYGSDLKIEDLEQPFGKEDTEQKIPTLNRQSSLS
jgi:hypothetical protein